MATASEQVVQETTVTAAAARRSGFTAAGRFGIAATRLLDLAAAASTLAAVASEQATQATEQVMAAVLVTTATRLFNFAAASRFGLVATGGLSGTSLLTAALLAAASAVAIQAQHAIQELESEALTAQAYANYKRSKKHVQFHRATSPFLGPRVKGAFPLCRARPQSESCCVRARLIAFYRETLGRC
jgi:hypothetical protein